MNEDFKNNNIDKWTVKLNKDGYKSPIAMIVEDVNIKIENDIVKAIQNYDIKVDREELAKALAYDRDQYSKGFAEAREKYETPTAEWIETELTEEYRQYGFDLRVVCSRCGSENSYFTFNEDHEPISITYIRSRFCPFCGAKMIKDFTGEAIP